MDINLDLKRMYLLVLVSCGKVKARDYGMRLQLKLEIAASTPDAVNSLDSYAWRACLACSRVSDAFVTGDASTHLSPQTQILPA